MSTSIKIVDVNNRNLWIGQMSSVPQMNDCIKLPDDGQIVKVTSVLHVLSVNRRYVDTAIVHTVRI